MITTHALTAGSAPPEQIAAARDLFQAYGAFLRTLPACHTFDFLRFEDEIRTLPSAFTEKDGELLLALREDGTAVGCIAFRTSDEDPSTCEIKRLFVPPRFRGQRIAEQLVTAALDRATARGFRSAMLDTEPSAMGPALALYRKLGFTEFQPTRAHNPVDVIFLRRPIP